ncbi:MAG: ribokinase [Pseudomonadota bacterium]
MILNFGSINLDLVYRVAHLPTAGETLHSSSFERFLGGKGINQSIAVAQSGAQVRHIGCVGADGGWVCDEIENFGVRLDDIATVDLPTGHAIICVDDAGENQIVLASGANQGFSHTQIEAALGSADPGDWVILQNETNLVADIAKAAKARGLMVCYSAAPFDAMAVADLLPYLDLLAVNEGEAAALEAAQGKPATKLGVPHVLITRGSDGAVFHSDGTVYEQNSFPVTPVDTTGAGDTFLGAFMARFIETDPATALRFAAACAAMQVTGAGAAGAIPAKADVEAFLKDA